jgi:hypothetical protein
VSIYGPDWARPNRGEKGDEVVVAEPATQQSVSSPINAQTVKNSISKRRRLLTSFLRSSATIAVTASPSIYGACAVNLNASPFACTRDSSRVPEIEGPAPPCPPV